MVDGTGIIGVDMVCPLGGAVSPPQPPNYDNVEMEGMGSLTLQNSLKAPLERLELIGNSMQGENPAPDNPQEIKSAGKHDEVSGKYLFDVKVTGENLLSNKSADWQIGKGLSWSTYPNDPISIYRVINSAVNVINLKPSTTYSIVNNSEKIVISRMIERNLSENGIKEHDVRSSKYTFATNQNTMNAILQIKKVDGTELLSSDIESIKIMLVEGEVNDPTPYEPYTEQTLTLTSDRPITKWDKLVEQGGQYGWRFDEASGKYFIDVKVIGKNFFDINNYVGSIEKISESEFHTEAKWGTLIGDINLKAGGKYNISYTFEIDSITNSDCGVRIKCTKSNGTVSYIFDLPKMTGYVCNYAKSAVVPVGTVKCEILLYTDVKLKIGGTFKKLMIAEDSENVALNIYEPYTEQILTLTSDRPITKWDKLVEQGGEYGWLYQSAAKEYIGDNSVELYDTGFYFKLSDKKIVNGEGYLWISPAGYFQKTKLIFGA